MRAGDLRQQVTIQHFAAVSPQRSGSGQPEKAWADLATTWAAIEPLRGSEFFASDAVQSEVKVRIRIRHRDGITAAMRVSHGGLYYMIESVINVEARDRELHLMCSQGVANG